MLIRSRDLSKNRNVAWGCSLAFSSQITHIDRTSSFGMMCEEGLHKL